MYMYTLHNVCWRMRQYKSFCTYSKSDESHGLMFVEMMLLFRSGPEAEPRRNTLTRKRNFEPTERKGNKFKSRAGDMISPFLDRSIYIHYLLVNVYF